MSLFRKKPADIGEDDGEVAAAVARAVERAEPPTDAAATADVPDVEPVRPLSPRAGTEPTAGPYDDADAADDLPRIDLGSIRVPAVDGMEVRMETAEDGQVVSVGFLVDGTVLQVQAFAAPRTEGIWDEVRADLAASLRSQGGTVDERTGPFGPELRARLTVQRPDGTSGEETARFLGVDGPRWFLRGVISGAGAVDEARAAVTEQMFRGTVVVRGDAAAPPREPLALTLPDGAGRSDGADGSGGPPS